MDGERLETRRRVRWWERGRGRGDGKGTVRDHVLIVSGLRVMIKHSSGIVTFLGAAVMPYSQSYSNEQRYRNHNQHVRTGREATHVVGAGICIRAWDRQRGG